MAEKKNKYVEPADFIPDAIQKKLKITFNSCRQCFVTPCKIRKLSAWKKS